MEKRLYDAAKEGNVISLINLLREDELILDRYCILTSFRDTPLHVAAMLGHAEFCFELVRRKPELAGELDSRRSSPLHLASAKGYTEIVKALVRINPQMCFSCDTDGRNPLHIAAIRGKVAVLKELLEAQRDAARERADLQGETILHLCVQHFQVEALKLLIEVIDDQEFVNAKDNNGNSILHLAVAEKQIEIIKFLLQNSTGIEVNSPNAYGFTEMDILEQSRRDVKDLDIAECLQDAGALKSRDTPPPSNSSTAKSSKQLGLSHLHRRKSWRNYMAKQRTWIGKKQDSLMIVASLVATMAFQAALNPPSGVWQDNPTADSTDNLAPVAGASNPTADPNVNPAHVAGTSILGDQYVSMYGFYIVCNTAAFVSSLSTIFLLMSGLPLKRRVFMCILVVVMWIAITSTALVYVISVGAIVPDRSFIISIATVRTSVWAWLGLMAIVLLLHCIRVVTFVGKKSKRILRRQRQNLCMQV